MGLIATGVLLVVAVVAGVLAYSNWRKAEKRKREVIAEKERVEREKRRTARQLERLVAFSAASMDDRPLLGTLLLTELKDKREPLDGKAIALNLGQQAVPSSLLRGHGARLTAVDVSADGARVVTASVDGTARIWRADGRGAPRTLAGHTGWVLDARFSPDGERIVTASADGTARIWRASTGKALGVLKGHKKRVTTASFTVDGKAVLTTSDDGTARLWSSAGKLIKVFGGHPGPVTAAAASVDGRRVVTGAADGTRLWSSAGKLEIAVKGRPVHAVTLSKDGQRVVSALDDGTAVVWAAGSGVILATLAGHKGPIRAAAFSPDDRRVLTASAGGTARIHQADGAGTPVVLRGHRKGLLAASFSANGERVLTASDDGTARLWWAANGVPLVELRQHSDAVVAARFSPDGQRVFTASADRTAAVWSAVVPKRRITTLGGHRREVTSVDAVKGGGIVSASADGLVQYWVVGRGGVTRRRVLGNHRTPVTAVRFNAAGTRVMAVTRQAAHVTGVDGGPTLRLAPASGRVSAAALHPGGGWALVGSSTGVVQLMAADASRRAVTMPGRHARAVTGATFSRDGKLAATGSADGSVRIYWLSGGKVLRFVPLEGHSDRVHSVRFSAGGTKLATSSRDRTARVWKVGGEAAPVVLQGHTDEVTDARFSADGKFVVTASYDRTARIWPTGGQGIPVVVGPHPGTVRAAALDATGSRVITASADEVRVQAATGLGRPLVLRGHTGQVNHALLGPDGHSVISVSADRTVKVWDISMAWQALVKELAGRTTVCLTPLERERYLAELPRRAAGRYMSCEKRNKRQPGKHAGAKIKIALNVTPPDAEATIDGKPITSNPAELTSTGMPRVLELSAPGYMTRTVQFSDTMSRTFNITLAKGLDIEMARRKLRDAIKGGLKSKVKLTLTTAAATMPPPPPPLKLAPPPPLSSAKKYRPVKVPAPAEPDAGPPPDLSPAPDLTPPPPKDEPRAAPKPPPKKQPQRRPRPKKKKRKSLYFDDDL